MEQIDILKNFITDNFLFGKGNSLNYETDFLKEGIIDSIGILELVCFVEETFNFGVDEEEILHENFSSISKLNKYINQKLNINSMVEKCAASQE